jgi:very-short-patch-repair endonuclease
MPKEKLIFAKQLRQTMTDAEQRLWRYLRRHHLGAKFKRQQPIGRYVADFVCFENRLIVEVDGGQHLESVADEQRDAWLRSRGFEILRFWNNEVLEQTEAVLAKIYEMLSSASATDTPLSPRGRGAGGEGAEAVQNVAPAATAASPSPQPLSREGRGANNGQLT